ncbi:cell division protein ZapD [Piscinibacter sp. Jin2]|uniref:Cell division protein ZapD n=1 Tax=Aquariibacter lacus TaxID=2801332 RepID=A0A9X0XC70_9BURK|nr:cell division protein ZapD [Piscinibacter lacus]MBL0719155.1 cell division protein ZapD [Piscinibacter lacus]
MILYEYPFNESTRTLLRLEHLCGRLATLIAREEALDHHHALAALFEIVDVAARADLKTDLLRELDRHRAQLAQFRGNPAIAEGRLEAFIQRIDGCHAALQQTVGKAGQGLSGNDWLMSIRSRITIPGGTCSFDLPAYYAWQQGPATRRQQDLQHWTRPLEPWVDALTLALRLIREAGHPQMVAAPGGLFQQSLPQNRSFHLLRLRLPRELDLVPEISGHRLLVSVRLMRQDAEGRLRPAQEDTSFELSLCG